MSETQYPQCLVVDFFGAPGAGKTYVSKAIATYLRDRGVRTLMLREILFPKRYSREWFASRFGSLVWIGRHPLYTWRLRCAISATQQSQSRDRRRFRLAWIRTWERIDRFRSQYQVILVDHGLAQLLWSIGYGADPLAWDEAIRRFRPLMKLSNLTVVVDVDQATTMNRLQQRSQEIGVTSRIQDNLLSDEQTWAIVDRLRTNVIDALESRDDSACNLTTFSNDIGNDNAAAIKQLAMAIEHLLKTEADCPAAIVSNFLKLHRT